RPAQLDLRDGHPPLPARKRVQDNLCAPDWFARHVHDAQTQDLAGPKCQLHRLNAGADLEIDCRWSESLCVGGDNSIPGRATAEAETSIGTGFCFTAAAVIELSDPHGGVDNWLETRIHDRPANNDAFAETQYQSAIDQLLDDFWLA